jgi:hypothetical protein
MQDDEYAKQIAKIREKEKADKGDKPAPPRWETWSNEREGLARVEDAVRGLGQTIVGAFGGKPGEFKPSQRPETKIDKAAADVRSDSHKKLASRFIAGRKRL